VPSMRIASPERRWRAALAPLAAALIGWCLSLSSRLGVRPGGSPELPLTARIVVTCIAFLVGLCLAVLIMRTHLAVSDEGLADHRMLRVVRIPWPLIEGVRVGRPGALWGGFCVIADCRDEMTVDLMSTRAYSRVPSASHLDELQRICWTIEEAVAKHAG
jgi:hypothetical protein